MNMNERIAEAIRGGIDNIVDIADEIGAHPVLVHERLRAMVLLGVVERVFTNDGDCAHWRLASAAASARTLEQTGMRRAR